MTRIVDGWHAAVPWCPPPTPLPGHCSHRRLCHFNKAASGKNGGFSEKILQNLSFLQKCQPCYLCKVERTKRRQWTADSLSTRQQCSSGQVGSAPLTASKDRTWKQWQNILVRTWSEKTTQVMQHCGYLQVTAPTHCQHSSTRTFSRKQRQH